MTVHRSDQTHGPITDHAPILHDESVITPVRLRNWSSAPLTPGNPQAGARVPQGQL
jgi:hypothetical protein